MKMANIDEDLELVNGSVTSDEWWLSIFFVFNCRI